MFDVFIYDFGLDGLPGDPFEDLPCDNFFTPDERGNYPCLCERELDYNPIWWVSDSQSRGPHLFCLRCTSRFLPHEIDEALTKWNIKQKVVHVDFNIKNLKESL